MGEIKNTEGQLIKEENNEKIVVIGARVHNLRNVDVEIPRN